MWKASRRLVGSRQPSSSSLVGEKSQLYVVYYHGGDSRSNQLYSVYALDVNNLHDDGDVVKPLPEPLVSLDRDNYPNGMGFASLGSKIYMLGGRYLGPKGKLPSSNVYLYDTMKKLLKKGPSMTAGKSSPIVVTISGKIYVISSSFFNEPMPRVEVFNPTDDSWATLPELIDHDDFNYKVEAHAVHGSTIFLSMAVKGIYCLDVTEPFAWRRVEFLGGVDKFPFCGAAQFIDRIWYATGKHIIQSYDITTTGDYGFLTELPLLPGEPKFKPLHFFVHIFVVDLGVGKLGLIRTGLDNNPYAGRQRQGNLYITLDVFQVANNVHSLSFTRLYSSTYVMEANPAVFGFLGACFLI